MTAIPAAIAVRNTADATFDNGEYFIGIALQASWSIHARFGAVPVLSEGPLLAENGLSPEACSRPLRSFN
jgi:hypothetical protein